GGGIERAQSAEARPRPHTSGRPLVMIAPEASAGNEDRALQAVHLSDVSLASNDAQREFFERALDRASTAEARAGAVERWFTIAGPLLRVTFAGETLIGTFLPRLAESEVPPAADHDAWFHVWDSQSTGIAMVPPICPREHFTNRGDMWSLLSRRYRSAFHMDDGHLSLFDAKSATGVHWVHAADLLSDAARTFPWRDLLHWWMQARGGQLVAGSVLGQGGKGVFVLGMSEDSRQALINLGTAGGLSLLADGWMVRAPA